MKIFLKYSKSEVNLWGFASDFFDVLGASWGHEIKVKSQEGIIGASDAETGK